MLKIKDSNDAAYAHYTWSVQTGYNPAQGIKFVHNIQSKSPKRFDNLHRAHQLTCMSTISKQLDKWRGSYGDESFLRGLHTLGPVRYILVQHKVLGSGPDIKVKKYSKVNNLSNNIA